ncbi:MAG: HlyD family efflux transporter periplasmic adaptor subunit, partial [Planctomycetes bacterium]|nr:HlyD family efflux transporter periplasmic adaptor subunit [Planctomycetota bacterium]
MSTTERTSDRLSAGLTLSASLSKPRVVRNGRRRSLFLALLLIPVLGVGALAYNLASDTKNGPTNLILDTVGRKSFTVEVSERGNLESKNNVEHACEVEGRVGGGMGGGGGGGGGTTILSIIDEGTLVKKGDVMVELDASNLEDGKQTQTIALETAESALAKAKADYETAVKAVEEYEKGTAIQDEKTHSADLTVAQENLKRAQESAKYTDTLYRRGFVNKEELEAAQFAVTNAELTLDKAQTALNNFRNVTKSKMLTQLHGDVASKERALRAEETKVEQETSRLQKIDAQLTKTKIYAKADGMVVYYRQANRWGSQEDQIQEGAVVRERQKIIILPDLTNMLVRVLVHESKVDWVRPGQRAQIRVEAFAGKVLTGAVERVSTTAEQSNWFEQDKRNYPVFVKIDDSIEGLKPGMTAQTVILVDKLTDVLAVPIQCVQTVGRRNYCYVYKADGTWEQRPVQLGKGNDT